MVIRSSILSFEAKLWSSVDWNDPVQTAAYSKDSLEYLVSSQQRIMDGAGPKMNRPGGGPKGTKGATVAESGRD